MLGLGDCNESSLIYLSLLALRVLLPNTRCVTKRHFPSVCIPSWERPLGGYRLSDLFLDFRHAIR